MAAPFSFSIRRTLIALLGLMFVISSGGSVWRPATVGAQGATPIRGVTGPVMIERDAAGVAHIRAGSEVDAHFGLGYAHAQDRLWQMEFQRRRRFWASRRWGPTACSAPSVLTGPRPQPGRA
jgi:acyl-homoserine lactone acylase PvdQ